MAVKAAILGVGSELISGQIINTDAAWISARLEDMGYEITRHLVVDDIESEIREGLDLLITSASMVFVTGGLGPTSDDLTRNAVAAWCGEPLVYDPESWNHIERHFARFSRSVPEANRQQCYFPKSAEILSNVAGTANGFVLRAREREIWVLPGPPREIEAIWRDHIESRLATRIPVEQRRRQRLWRTIGRGESHIAELVQPLVAGRDVELAFRAHPPYIEVKLRFAEQAASAHQDLVNRISEALRPWLYERDAEDHPTELVRRMARFPSVAIHDEVTQGYLFGMLAPALRKERAAQGSWSMHLNWEATPAESAAATLEASLNTTQPVAATLSVSGIDAQNRWAIGLKLNAQHAIELRPCPYQSQATEHNELVRTRNRLAIAALACKAWLELLDSLDPV